MSQIKISDVTNHDDNKKKNAKDQIVNKSKKTIETKFVPKSIEPKIKEKKPIPVYMKAPYKTEPSKTCSKSIPSLLEPNTTPRLSETGNLSKRLQEIQEKKNINLNTEKKENRIDSNMINQLKISSVKNNLTLAKIAPNLHLPNSTLNLINQNNKYRYQVLSSLEEKRKKVSKKHSFIKKIEFNNSEKNSKLLENNALVGMKNCFHEVNCLTKKIQNKLKILDNSAIFKIFLILCFNFYLKDQLEILILYFKSKIFAKKSKEIEFYLDEFYKYGIRIYYF